jgi:hypothetical protein
VKAFEGLNCFYTNADSLPNKLYELKRRVQKATDSFDIIGATEVYPKKGWDLHYVLREMLTEIFVRSYCQQNKLLVNFFLISVT